MQTNDFAVIGGEFTKINGADRNFVGRLSSDGTLDLSFDPGMGANDFVRALLLEVNNSVSTSLTERRTAIW